MDENNAELNGKRQWNMKSTQILKGLWGLFVILSEMWASFLPGKALFARRIGRTFGMDIAKPCPPWSRINLCLRGSGSGFGVRILRFSFRGLGLGSKVWGGHPEGPSVG